ncbi:MAG TPA: hypothetical protein VF432_22165 [Thermoanaerobaculia bacterium]
MADANRDEQQRRLFDALGESIDDTSADDLRDEIRAEGRDPDGAIAGVRAVFGRIQKKHRQAKLAEARTTYAATIESLKQPRSRRIPADPAKQRALFLHAIQTQPQLTARFRDLEAISPEEIVQILEQLQALDLLPDEEP